MGSDRQTVLILTPVKNATGFLDTYFAGLDRLTYPASSTSLGFLESDSDDATYDRICDRLEPLRTRYASVQIWQKNFDFRIPRALPRWTEAFQIPRRKVLAKARNQLLFRALKDQNWVLWLDVDVIDYPPDLIERMIATGRDIVHPHCVERYGGPTFDLNAWRDHGRVHMDDLRGGPDLVRLDTVGGTVAARARRCPPRWTDLSLLSLRGGKSGSASPRSIANQRRTGDGGVRHHGDGHGVPVLGHAEP
jgi:hypothetical protein